MATHGTIGEYDHCKEDWVSYCERLEHYFAANDVDDAGKQRAILLSVCGATTYQLIRNLAAPAKSVDKSFRELVTLVKDHHTPPPSVTVQRFNFNSRSQKDGETVAQFVAELRRLSEHCIPRQVGRHATRSPSMRHQRFAGAATPTVRDRPHFQESV